MATRYQVVYQDLCDKITKKAYQPGDMLPTEKAMAEYYNVSRITMQKALQILVSQNVIERIPGRGTFLKGSPQNLNMTERNQFFALALPIQDPEMMTVICSVQEAVARNGCNLTIHFTNKGNIPEPEIIDKIIGDGVQGLIVYAEDSCLNSAYYRQLQKRIPVVFIDKLIDEAVTNAVLSNNFEGSYQMTEYLIRCGHKRIAYFYFHTRATSLTDRRNGYRVALEDHQIPADEDLMVDIERPQSIPDIVPAFLAAHKDVTAIMCCTDEMAATLCNTLQDYGIRVPEDISISGFDNSVLGQSVRPALTTVAQDFAAIGREAARLLFDIQQNWQTSRKVVYIPTKIIKRESVRDLREDE